MGARLAGLLLIPIGLLHSSLAFAGNHARDQIRFGAEMAEKGNWREAIFRWKKALEQEPNNPRLHNNLAVAYETMGDYGLAEGEYKLALQNSPYIKEIRENYALFQNFYERYRKTDTTSGGPPGGPKEPEPPAGEKPQTESPGAAPSTEAKPAPPPPPPEKPL